MCVLSINDVCRLNDETFLQNMNVGSQDFVSQETLSQEYERIDEEEDLEMEKDGFVEAPKGRSANYTDTEDELICASWKKVGLDLAVGTEQPTHTYWKRMRDFFNSHNKHGNQRSEVSFRHRWTTISTECQKWLACLASVERINPSGTNGGVC
jgi:hypothetical protein